MLLWRLSVPLLSTSNEVRLPHSTPGARSLGGSGHSGLKCWKSQSNKYRDASGSCVGSSAGIWNASVRGHAGLKSIPAFLSDTVSPDKKAGIYVSLCFSSWRYCYTLLLLRLLLLLLVSLAAHQPSGICHHELIGARSLQTGNVRHAVFLHPDLTLNSTHSSEEATQTERLNVKHGLKKLQYISYVLNFCCLPWFCFFFSGKMQKMSEYFR